MRASGAIHPVRAAAPRAFGSRRSAKVKAIHFPSGDQTGAPFTPSSWYASPPGAVTRANQVEERSRSRCDWKLSTLPSGDQRGTDDSREGSVKRKGSPSGWPSRSRCSQTSRCRRLSSSTTVVFVKATRSPFGERATSPTSTMR